LPRPANDDALFLPAPTPVKWVALAFMFALVVPAVLAIFWR
jgi:hypothetical protein